MIQPGTYNVDASHSEVSGVVRHLMVSKVRAKFRNFSATIVVDEDPMKSSVEATINTASIDTGNNDRDDHLISADFLDVENHPTITFNGKFGTFLVPDSVFEVDGELTILGKTQPVTLEVEFNGEQIDPWGGTRIGFSARTTIDREDFGMTWNQAIEAGGVVVGKKVEIQLELEAIKQ